MCPEPGRPTRIQVLRVGHQHQQILLLRLEEEEVIDGLRLPALPGHMHRGLQPLVPVPGVVLYDVRLALRPAADQVDAVQPGAVVQIDAQLEAIRPVLGPKPGRRGEPALRRLLRQSRLKQALLQGADLIVREGLQVREVRHPGVGLRREGIQELPEGGAEGPQLPVRVEPGIRPHTEGVRCAHLLCVKLQGQGAGPHIQGEIVPDLAL